MDVIVVKKLLKSAIGFSNLGDHIPMPYTAKKYTIPDQETYSKRILNITIPLGFL